MKFFHFIIFLTLVTSGSAAQQNHFIYIQTENKQPFYVRMADRLLSSSSVGYLVIPKLQEGKYELGIGFPRNEWPLQKISLTVKNNDAGYVLKNFEPKGWGLFNLQTMDIVMSSPITSSKDTLSETKADGFADVLADVVSTPSIKQKPVVKDIKEEKEMAVTKSAAEENIKKEAAVAEEKAIIVPVPVKLSSVIESSGRTYIYVDRYENATDTIRFFIPNTAVEIKEKSDALPTQFESIKKSENEAVLKSEVKVENNAISMQSIMRIPDMDNRDDTVVTIDKPVVLKDSATNKPEKVIASKDNTEPKSENKFSIMTNSDCKSNATGDDFLKLRKKMAAETSDEEMVAVAKKAFKTKCFSTEQISNLSVLFLKDEGRYNFFDTAYPRVFDSHNFSGLVSKLTEEYFISRFKAMIRH